MCKIISVIALYSFIPILGWAQDRDFFDFSGDEIPIIWNHCSILQWHNNHTKLTVTHSPSVPSVMTSNMIDIRNKKDLFVKGLRYVNSQNKDVIACYNCDSIFLYSIEPEGQYQGSYEIWKTLSFNSDVAFIRIVGDEKYNTKLYENFSFESRYKSSPNYGKKIAFFGGSFSSIEAGRVAKNFFRMQLNSPYLYDFGVGGAGLALNTYHKSKPCSSLYYQVKEALTSGVNFDIFVIWASTNDFYTYPALIGAINSYTKDDGYSKEALNTQSGGINAAVRLIRENNPNALILFWGSLPFFSKEYGYKLDSAYKNKYGYSYKDYIEAQKESCRYNNIPYLDQWTLCGVDESNYKNYYNPKDNYLHPLRIAYEKWMLFQIENLAYTKTVDTQAKYSILVNDSIGDIYSITGVKVLQRENSQRGIYIKQKKKYIR